jgi:hypothetical protein
VTDDATVTAQLTVLAASPKARWKKFRKFEMVCGGCGDTLIQVMTTQPWVILTRAKDTGRAWEWYRYDADPRQRLSSSCHCQTIAFTRGLVLEYVAAGRTKVLHPAKFNRGRDTWPSQRMVDGPLE